MATMHYGTSSWSSKDWVGPFYPEGTRPADFLTRYAEQFATVEADTTYYGVPRATMVEGWARKTPASFRICAKFPRTIVHAGEGPRPDPARVLVPDAVATETEAFLAVMELLGERCGPLVLQFPYFSREVFPDRQVFLERLDAYLAALPDSFRYAVEVRNRAWLDEELLGVLRSRRAALVLVDMARMPHPRDVARARDVVTADFVYARLIGDRKATERRTKSFDRIVVDQGWRLDLWAELAQELAVRVADIWIFANNHYAGFGPGTIRSLQELIEGSGPPSE